jgi:glycosyltransferase involved in cell wall biosynthesis
LVEAGLSVVIIAERRDHAWPAVEWIDGYEVRRLSCWYRRHFHVITSVLSFASFLIRRGREFDIWHVHNYGFHAALAVALGKVLRRPVVCKLTNSGPMGIAKMGSGVSGYILEFFHRRVSACIAITKETRKEAICFGIPPQRIHLIPNGVDGRQFHPSSVEERSAARRALGLDCERLVLYVGRLSAEKNPLGLLDAWAALDPNVRAGSVLALVGDGPEGDKVNERIHALNLKESVHLAGSRDDVATWYRAADLYVNSSRNEGLSNTMIEALASGLPVVATRVSGVKEHLDETGAGVVVPIGDTSRLSSAIQMLLENGGQRMNLRDRGRCVFERRFSLDLVASQVHRVYESLLPGS